MKSEDLDPLKYVSPNKLENRHGHFKAECTIQYIYVNALSSGDSINVCAHMRVNSITTISNKFEPCSSYHMSRYRIHMNFK